MTKQLAFLPLAALVMSGCVFNAEPKRAGAKLTAPSAPFKADAAAPSKSGTFRPELKGNRVIAGDKVLEFTHDGLLKYYAAGRIIGNIYLPFVIVEKNKAKKNQWLCTDVNLPRENFDLHECGMINKDGRDVYRKVIVKDGKKAECLTSFALSPDGKASLSYEWTQFASQDFSLQPSALIFNIPTASIRSTTVNIDGVGKLIPENAPVELFHSPGFKEAELFAGSPEKSIKISSSPTCVEFYVDARDLDTLVRFYPKTGQNQLTVFFDISRGVVGGVKSAQTYAGIDFMAIENLEMPDINSSRNLLTNPSFEQGLSSYWQIPEANYSGYETWKETPFAIDGKSAQIGHNSLKLAAKENILKGSMDVRGITAFVYQFRTFAIPLERGKYTFSFYAKGEPRDAQRVGVWFPNAAWIGNSFTSIPGAQKIFAVSPEWTRYALTFDVPASMPVSAAIGADSKSGKSHVWLDGLQLEKGDKASAFISRPAEGKLVTVKADNFLENGDNVGAVFEIYSKPEAAGKVKLSVKDFFNEKHFNGEYGFKCDKDGKARLPLPFDGKFNRGVFILKAEYELSDGTKNYDFHRFSLMTPLENKHRLKNIFADNYGTAEQRCDFLKMLERYKKIGIGAKTHVQNWDREISDTYREYGVEPFNAVMVSLIFGKWGEGGRRLTGFAICDDAANYAVKPDDPSVLIKDFHLDGNGELTGEYLAKFKNAVAKNAKDHPWISTWGFGCELKGKLCGIPGFCTENEYAKLLKAFYLGVKEGNPRATVFQDAANNMEPQAGIAETGRLLTETNQQGGCKFDLIGIHTYRHRPESPDLDEDARALFKMLERNGYKDTPVFWPEGMLYGPYAIPQWGISSAEWVPPVCWYYGALSYDMGWTEKISAAWRARSWLVALKYQDRVKAFQSGAFINNFEMDLDLTPFATQKISNTLGRLLGDAYFKKDIRFAPYVRCYIFEDVEKRPVAAVWCHHPNLDAGTMNPPLATANFQGSLAQVFDLMECERSFAPDEKGDVSFPISSFPLFFRGTPGTVDTFIKAFDNASLITGEDISPLMISGKPSTPETVEIAVKNYLSKAFSGIIEIAAQKLPLSIAPSGTSTVGARLPETLRPDRIVKENLQLALKTASGTFANDISFEGFVCKKTARGIKIDAELDDWKDIPAVKFVNRYSAQGLNAVSASDFSGDFKIAWDEKGIYVCARITDDKFTHEAFAKPGYRWSNDCLQIYFDSFCDARTRQQRGYDENDYEYGMFPNADAKSSIVYRHKTPDPQLGLATQAPQDDTVAKDIPSAFRRTADGYVYEVFFPAKYLLPIKLERGSAIGFGLYAADCDDPLAQYPHRVKSALTLTLSGTGCYNNPHLWPAMLLWE